MWLSYGRNDVGLSSTVLLSRIHPNALFMEVLVIIYHGVLSASRHGKAHLKLGRTKN